MKKIYLSVVFCCLCFAGFATTWYSQNAGDASDLENWNSLIGGGGITPGTFATPGDIWIMQNNMTCSVPLSIAGSLTIDSVYFIGPNGILAIGENLTLTGAGVIDAAGTLTIAISGNLSITDSSYIINNPAYTTIVFNNASSTVATPQTIFWSSTQPGEWAQMNINAGCTVQLLSNVTLPPVSNAADSVNGTLICGNFVLNCNANDNGFLLSSGASLYTANIYGVDSSVINPGNPLFYDLGANYVFNGTAPQATGFLLPAFFNPGGSVTVNNATGVTLQQSTNFDSGSTLTLANGTLTLGIDNVNLDASAVLAGTFSSANMIVANGGGQLQKGFIADSAFLFPIGDNAGNYSPVTLTVSGSAFAPGAYAGVNVTNAKHPANANTTNYLNRYWSVNVSGVSDLVYVVDSANYVATDVTGTEANISMGQFTGALPWLKFGATNATTHTLPLTVATNPVSDFTGITTASPTVTTADSVSICFGSSDSMYVISATGDSPLTYSWAPATGLSVTTGTSVIATPDSTTIYTVTVTDGNGFTASSSTTVYVHPLPFIFNVTGGGSYCEGTGGKHIGLDSSWTGIRYQLYHNDTAIGSPVNGTGVPIDFGADTLAGLYTVVATDTITHCISNMNGSVPIFVTPVVVPTVSIIPSITDTICQGTAVSFSSSETNGGEPSYQWTVNDSVYSSGSSFGYTPVNGDVVNVRLISSATCAIPDTVNASTTISVSTHETPTVSLTATPGTTVCEGTGINITATPTFGGTAPTFIWVKNTLPVSTADSFSYVPANGDNIYCIMQSNYFCVTTDTAYSNVINMTVVTPVVPSVNIIALHGTSISKHETDSLLAVVTNGGASPSYQWYLNGASVPGATTNIYFKTGGFTNRDSVSCIVTRNDACALATFNSVIISVSSVGVTSVGLSAGDIMLVPNPNSGTFTIKGSLGAAADEGVMIEVTDVLGQVVYKNQVIAANGTINEQIQLNSSLANGTYLLNLRSASGNSTLRFVKQQ